MFLLWILAVLVGIAGVLALYRRDRDAFTKEQAVALGTFATRLGRILASAGTREPVG